MEATFSSENAVDFQQTTQRSIPEDGRFLSYRCFPQPCQATARETTVETFTKSTFYSFTDRVIIQQNSG
jgi:hypothetical protein